MTVESSIFDGAVVSLVLRDGRENYFFVFLQSFSEQIVSILY